MSVDPLKDLNDDSFMFVNAMARHTAWMHVELADYAKYGVVLFALALFGAALYSRRHEPRSLAATAWGGIGTLLAVALNQPLGRAFHEARPYVHHPHALMLVDRSTDFSFPSDHAVMAGAVAAGVFLVSRRLGAVVAVLAVAMAFTRVYVGAHYPADVLAGLVFGAAVVLLGWLVVRRPLTRLAEALRRTRLRPLLVDERAAGASA